jgi:hypothetical protein
MLIRGLCGLSSWVAVALPAGDASMPGTENMGGRQREECGMCQRWAFYGQARSRLFFR